MSDDLDNMACAEWMAAISAEADGEDPGVDPRLLAAHLESCAACRTFRTDVQGLRRATAVVPAPEMPDLSRRVSKLNAVADRASRWWVVRGLLALVAVTILALSVPDLLGHSDEAVHEARHVGAFSVAYAVALLAVVVRPARARTIFPVTLVLAGALLITAAIDVVEGHVPLVNETAHLPELLSVALVWLLARPLPERTGQDRPAGDGRPALRLIDDDAAGGGDAGRRAV